MARVIAAFGALVWTLSAPFAAADTPCFMITSPTPGEPAFGVVEVAASSTCAPAIERVVFFADGRRAGEARKAPFHFAIDVGQANAEHVFRVEAVAADGSRLAAEVRTPRIQVDGEVAFKLQQLYVTVSRGGAPELGLSRADFEVLDRRAKQRIVTFERGDVPFTAVVLLDASTSMAGPKLEAAMQGVRSFAGGMQPLDEARVAVFSDRLLHATPFVTASTLITSGMGEVAARGGTAVNDHLYLAAKALEERQGRRVVLLLSDGMDSHSVLDIEDVHAQLRRSQALVYWMRLEEARHEAIEHDPRVHYSAWRDGKGYRRQIDTLDRLVADSGGRTMIVSSVEAIEPAFRDILRELRDQYVLSYYPTNSVGDGSWHEVDVRAHRRGVDVRTCRGYVDY